MTYDQLCSRGCLIGACAALAGLLIVLPIGALIGSYAVMIVGGAFVLGGLAIEFGSLIALVAPWMWK